MKWARKCYDSLRHSTIPCDIVTIDNGSTDGTINFIKENYPEVDIRVMNKNLGFGRANNIGLQIAQDKGYQFAYLLNQDAWITPTTMSELIAVSQKFPDFGILSPMQMSADERHFDEKFATNVIGNHQQRRPLLSEDLFFGRKENVYEVSFVMAAHWLITRKCLETTGGFSPTFFHYGEDDNYLNRARFWKFKIGIVPNAKAVHDRADSKWDAKKELYISVYTTTLNLASNPLRRHNINTLIRKLFVKAIRTRNKQIWRYSVRLLKERTNILTNYKLSLATNAFLNK